MNNNNINFKYYYITDSRSCAIILYEVSSVSVCTMLPIKFEIWFIIKMHETQRGFKYYICCVL